MMVVWAGKVTGGMTLVAPEAWVPSRISLRRFGIWKRCSREFSQLAASPSTDTSNTGPSATAGAEPPTRSTAARPTRIARWLATVIA